LGGGCKKHFGHCFGPRVAGKFAKRREDE